MARYSYSRAERMSWKNGFFAGLHAKKRKKKTRPLLKSKKRVKKAKDPGAWKRAKKTKNRPVMDLAALMDEVDDMISERRAIEGPSWPW